MHHSLCERLDALLLVCHLGVDVGELPLQAEDPRPRVSYVRLEQVGVVLGRRGRSRTRGVHCREVI